MRKDKSIQLNLFAETQKKETLKNVLLHYNKPKNDNEQLLNYQYDWLINGSEIAKSKYWSLSLTVAKRFLATQLRSAGKYVDNETFEAMALDGVIYFMKRYSRSDYYVKTSVITQIWGGVLFAFRYKTKGQKLFENAFRKANDLEIDFEQALILAKNDLEKKESLKTGKKNKNLKHKDFEKKQLKLFEEV